MIFKIENDFLRIEADTAGGELKSIFHIPRNEEYLWQGNPEWWPRRAPVLFPVVGKLAGNHYRVGNERFSLSQHGFARDSEFEIGEKSAASVQFVLRSSGHSLEIFPFPFVLRITYELKQRHLSVRYEVTNTGSDEMYFSIGAHPGFALRKGETLGDYYIEFEKSETLDRHLLDGGLFNGKTERVVNHAKIMNVNDDLMKKDAVVFKDMKSTRLFLKSHKSDYALKFMAPGFPYFGIWSKPGASFVCLEPWCGLADVTGFSGDFKDKEGIQSLAAEAIFERAFSIEIL